ncbi:unnamed protein product [Camellia sinensis]
MKQSALFGDSFSLIFFGLCMAQTSTFFDKQSSTMNRNIGNNFVIPHASIHTLSAIGMIICITAYEKIFVSALRKATNNEQGIRILQRIGIGMVFPVIAMAIAALVEQKRLREVEREIVRVERVGYLSMRVFWLAPLFIILGIGDGFTLVGLQEYFYDQVPDSMNLYDDTTEKLRSWTKEILVYHQTSTDAASNDDGDNDKYDTSRENGDNSAKVEEEPKCHEVAHNFGHSSNKESNGAMVERESEVVVVVAQA